MNQKVNFADLVGQAMASAELDGMRNVVEKELLHYDILFCLDRRITAEPYIPGRNLIAAMLWRQSF